MFEEVQKLLATLMMLAFIKLRLCIEFPLTLPPGQAFEVCAIAPEFCDTFSSILYGQTLADSTRHYTDRKYPTKLYARITLAVSL